jgi:hypothetical protein
MYANRPNTSTTRTIPFHSTTLKARVGTEQLRGTSITQASSSQPSSHITHCGCALNCMGKEVQAWEQRENKEY